MPDSIVVCGTGIAGLASALGFRKAGFNVTLIGPRIAPESNPGDNWHPRVYALSPSSKKFLSSLGVWSLMDSNRITAVDAMEVYGDTDGVINLHAWQASQPALAWIIESGEIERALHQALQVFGVNWVEEKFSELKNGSLITDSGREITFELLVGADGAKSSVRAASGIYHNQKLYGHTGVVTHLTTHLPHQNIALQWFTDKTVLALLPLSNTSQGNQMSMVWSMPDHEANELMAMPDNTRKQNLEQKLQAIAGARVGAMQVRSQVYGFPLTFEKTAMFTNKIALVGDAAHRVHPLAGQGLNLGLGDVSDLISTVSSKEPWRKAGDSRVLERYARLRAEPIFAMRAVTHGLHTLFNVGSVPAMVLRNAGMHIANRLPFLKRALITGAN